MKKNLFKIILIALIGVITFSFTACKYRQDGSVIQDAQFEISYTNTSNETVDITATFKLYETFAEKTTKHIEKLIKEGFYNNTQIVFDNAGSYLILGSYVMQGDEYKEIIADSSKKVDGEFFKNGLDNQGKLSTQTAGTLVMLRDPDDGKGESKYNSAKVTFAVILSASSALPKDYYTAFGKIDDESLEAFKTMKNDLYKDADGYTSVRYVGDRGEDGLLKVENGKYVNSYNYYQLNGSAYRKINGEMIEFDYAEVGDADHDLFDKLSNAHHFDNVVLPQNPITIKSATLK